MKWFDRWFYRKARWCWHRASIEYPNLKSEQDYLDKNYKVLNSLNGSDLMDRDSVVCVSEEISLERPMRFKVAAAEGGMIVEVSYYDAKNDRSITKHHIVADDVADKAHAIAKIVTWEFMKQPQQ